MNSTQLITLVCGATLFAAAEGQAAFSVKLTPVATREAAPPYGTYDITVVNNRAYLAQKSGGFFVYDVSNPESPVLLAKPNPGVVDYLSVVGNYAYCSLHNGDIKVVDVSSLPSAPVVSTSYLASGESFPANGSLYFAGWNGGLRIFDVQNPASPTCVQSYFNLPSDTLWGLHVQGNYAYATAGNAGLYIVNVADRANPVHVGTFNTAYSANSVFVEGRYAYVGGNKTDANGLRIIDVSNPAAPQELSGFGYTIGQPVAVNVKNGLAFVGEYNWSGGQGEVTVFDVGDPNNPKEVGYAFADDYLRDMEVVGNYVFIAQGGDGFKVFRIDYQNTVAPSITLQPKGVSLTAGQVATFTAATTGAPTPRLQWQRSTDGGATWQNLVEGAGFTGTDKTNLVVSATVAMNGNRFRAVATSVGGTNATTGATLTVSGLPLVTAQPQSRTALAGQSATFSVSAIGAPPLSYQWRLGQQLILGATNATLVLPSLAADDSGAYSVVVSNAYGAVSSAAATLTVVTDLTLPVALDAPALTWRTGGNANWQAQSVTAHDAVAAGRSGTITHSQQSYVETTVEGPGILSFWWKVSSESGYDFLKFLTNGTVRSSISGTVNWQQMTFNIPAGTQTLRWAYTKDGSTSAGMDTAWLDGVTFTSLRPRLAPLVCRGGTVTTSFDTLSGSNYVIEYTDSLERQNWTLLRTVTGNGATQTVTDTPGNIPQRFYRVRIQ